MTQINWRKWAFIVGFFGASQFVIVTSIAMLTYSGGIIIDPLTPGYSFWFNFFSDLGLTVAWSGQSNMISCVLFAITMILLSATMFPFYTAMKSLLSDSKKERLLSIAGSGIAYICAIAFLGVGLVPKNLNEALHNIFAHTGYALVLPLGILFSMALFLNKEFPNKYGLAFLIMTLMLFFYLILLLFNLGLSSLETVMINATGQKIITYILIFTLLFVSYGGWKICKNDK